MFVQHCYGTSCITVGEIEVDRLPSKFHGVYRAIRGFAVLAILSSAFGFIYSLDTRVKKSDDPKRKMIQNGLFIAAPVFSMIAFFAWIYIAFELWLNKTGFGWGWSFELISSAIQIVSVVLLNGPQ